ncbi:MAG: hypothetical protein QOJ94_3250, partial [Sphingomonadales bacterium]|nr:hypothetical protein [Sphingomonadales bacterium]
MPSAAAVLRSFAASAVDFALPPRCPACGTILPDPHRLCLACWKDLTFLGEPCCVRCGLPFEYGGEGDAECGRCLAEPPPFDRLRAAVAYGEVARGVALKLKHGGRPGVAETLAAFMLRHLDGRPDALLVPVPLHRWRIWRRGYNQAALIAGALARRAGLEARLDLVERVKATPVLRGMGPRERREAVRAAFRVPAAHRAALKGRAVTLIDDV